MVVISDAYNIRKIKNVKLNNINAVSTHSTFLNAFVPKICLAFPVNLPIAERYASTVIIATWLIKKKLMYVRSLGLEHLEVFQ